MFMLVYTDRNTWKDVHRQVRGDNVVAVAKEAAKRTGQSYAAILGYLQNQLKRVSGG